MNSAISSVEIILADNQALTSAGIKFLLQAKNNTTVREVRDKTSLYQAVNGSTSLVIMDYLYLENFKAESMADFRDKHANIPMLVITADQNKPTILQVLECGVNGFLFKDCYKDEIIRAVDSIITGEKFYCNKVFDILMESRQQQAAEDCLPTELTPREIEIIKLVVKAKSTADIADKLNLSPHTISTHRKNIIKKLHIKSPVELVTYAYDLGLIQKK